MIVTINNIDIDFKPAELIGQEIKRRDFLGGSEALQAILIDQNSEIVKIMMSQEDQRFPVGSFLPLAVGSEAIHASGFILQPISQGEPSGVS